MVILIFPLLSASALYGMGYKSNGKWFICHDNAVRHRHTRISRVRSYGSHGQVEKR